VSSRALRLALAVGLIEAAAAVVVVLTSHRESHKVATTVLAVTAGISFIASGLHVLRLRPENRTGFYLAAVGYLWFFAALGDANSNAVWTAGVFLGNLAFIPFAALVLAFPDGRLSHPVDRAIVGGTIVVAVFAAPLELLFAKHPAGCRGSHCGSSEIVVYQSDTVDKAVYYASTALVILLIVSAVTVLAHRYRKASVARRHVLLPVYAAAAAALVILSLNNLFATFSTRFADIFAPVFFVLFAAVPLAFGYGILRSRLARGSVADLVMAIGKGTPLREAMSFALGDPSLELAYWLEEGERFVDREGRHFELPGPRSGRATTIVEHEARRVGALVYDESLSVERELVESCAAAVALALDNERLETELRAQYDFLTTIVDTAPSLLVSIDIEGRIRNLNSATVRASGYDDEEEVRNRFFWDVFIAADEREAMIGRFRAAAPDFPPAQYENPFTNARGERMVIAWRSAPVRDDRGKVVRIVAGGLDITEHKRQEEELRASTARVVAAADEARRKLERNLHDGAQQRLVSLSVALRLSQTALATDPARAGEILAAASDELAQALEELRELARGIHPAVLTDRGLNAALESLAARMPLPVEVTAPAERLPAPIEAAVYYVVAESVANVVKHARASSIEVLVTAPNGRVLVEVADDGVGGARADGGSGLRGLADRVAVLDGQLRVESPAGGGTRIVAEIPLGQRSHGGELQPDTVNN
jgi:PAS domain S-box-containing protein